MCWALPQPYHVLRTCKGVSLADPPPRLARPLVFKLPRADAHRQHAHLAQAQLQGEGLACALRGRSAPQGQGSGEVAGRSGMHEGFGAKGEERWGRLRLGQCAHEVCPCHFVQLQQQQENSAPELSLLALPPPLLPSPAAPWVPRCPAAAAPGLAGSPCLPAGCAQSAPRRVPRSAAGPAAPPAAPPGSAAGSAGSRCPQCPRPPPAPAVARERGVGRGVIRSAFGEGFSMWMPRAITSLAASSSRCSVTHAQKA